LILGRNAREVTAVVANAPGALELVPSVKYGSDWLELRDAMGATVRKLPSADPFEEVYKSTDWYGLVPEYNTKYLDLSGGKTAKKKVPRTNFNKILDKVNEVQQLIVNGYFPWTYIHFGDDDAERSYERVVWTGDVQAIEGGSSPTLHDDHNGRIAATSGTRAELRFQKAAGPGDGTVPTRSGSAPEGESIRARFRHGRNGKGIHNLGKKDKPDGYGHQPSYNDPRAKWAAIYSIVKLMQRAQWHEQV